MCMLTCVHARMSASVHAHAAVCARHARAEVAEPAKHMARVSLPPQNNFVTNQTRFDEIKRLLEVNIQWQFIKRLMKIFRRH